MLQYPNDKGSVEDYRAFIHAAHGAGALVAMGTDLLALTLLTSPGELGADVAFGNCTALWRTAGLWRAARGLLCHER